MAKYVILIVLLGLLIATARSVPVPVASDHIPGDLEAKESYYYPSYYGGYGYPRYYGYGYPYGLYNYNYYPSYYPYYGGYLG